MQKDNGVAVAFFDVGHLLAADFDVLLAFTPAIHGRESTTPPGASRVSRRVEPDRALV